MLSLAVIRELGNQKRNGVFPQRQNLVDHLRVAILRVLKPPLGAARPGRCQFVEPPELDISCRRWAGLRTGLRRTAKGQEEKNEQWQPSAVNRADFSHRETLHAGREPGKPNVIRFHPLASRLWRRTEFLQRLIGFRLRKREPSLRFRQVGGFFRRHVITALPRAAVPFFNALRELLHRGLRRSNATPFSKPDCASGEQLVEKRSLPRCCGTPPPAMFPACAAPPCGPPSPPRMSAVTASRLWLIMLCASLPSPLLSPHVRPPQPNLAWSPSTGWTRNPTGRIILAGAVLR